MGIYSPTLGTQHMRSRHSIPANLTPYVTHLRQAGYYTSNASKTDYNFKGKDKALWDECSPTAHYSKRPKDKPFFSILNLTISHESNLFPHKIAANRKKGLIPESPRLDPTHLTLPPYLPDLPEIRHDFAIYHDTITALDKQIDRILTRLEKDGLTENTIIFYYSDHGGPTPRGKRYLHDTGVRIPLLIHVPEKWKKLSIFQNGTISNEIVSFVDLAPTLLSLAGLKNDPKMQGRPFLGPNRREPSPSPFAFLFADRFDEIYGFRRGIATGRYKYVRHFTPHTWGAPYSLYQFQMASWPAWHQAWKKGTLSGTHASLWENNQAAEELYDTQADPWELTNLAADPAHAQRLTSLRKTLFDHMLTIRDTGIIPEPLFDVIRSDKTLMETVNTTPEKTCRKLLELAFIASSGDPENKATLEEQCTQKNPIARFWGHSGLVTLGKKAASSEKTILAGLRDPFPVIRAQAAIALHNIGQKKRAVKALIDDLESDLSVTDEAIIINTLMQIRETKAIPQSWFAKHLGKNPSTNELRLGTLAQSISMLHNSQ